MLRRKTGRQNCLRMPPCAFALEGRRVGQQRHAPPAVGTDAVAARCHANHHRVTPAGTREPFQAPLRPAPRKRGAALCFCCAPGGARKRGCKRRCEGLGNTSPSPSCETRGHPPPEGGGEDGHVVQRRLCPVNPTPVRFTPPATGGCAENAALRAATTITGHTTLPQPGNNRATT